MGWRLFWEEKGIWWEVEGTGFVAMAPMVLLLNATKVVGVVGAITVAANALTFRHFYKKNIAPFPDPVDETKEVLAEFPIDKEGEILSPFSSLSAFRVDEEGEGESFTYQLSCRRTRRVRFKCEFRIPLS